MSAIRAWCAKKSRTLLISLLFIGLTSACAADYDLRPIVVVREDDCRATWRTPFPEFGGISALEYGKQKQIPITWAIVTWSASNNDGLSWADLRSYLDAAGGEAASHSVTHHAMPSMEQYIAEIQNSKAAIDANLGPAYPCKTFLQPGGWSGDAYMDNFSELNNPIGQAIRSTYRQSMAYLGTGWRIGNPYYRYGTTNIYSIDYPDATSAEAVLATLDVVAHTPGLVFVFSCHGVQASSGTTSFEVRAGVLRAFMDRLAELRDSGAIRLMGLDQAFGATYPEDINRIPDADLETCQPGPVNPKGPWTLVNAEMEENMGVFGSRCAVLLFTGSLLKTGSLLLGPDRYLLSWHQLLESGTPGSNAIRVLGDSFGPNYNATRESADDYSPHYNSAVGVWEKRSALLRCHDTLSRMVIQFTAGSSAGFRIDNVSLVHAPLSAAAFPSNVSVTPTPTQCAVSWDTPTDQTVTSVQCRYGTRTHPMTTAEGTSGGTIPAAPGARQQITFPINWTTITGAYFSVFPVRGSNPSDPEIEYIIVDSSLPSVSQVQISALDGGQLRAEWAASAPKSGIYTNRYAVGTTSGGSDVISWTDTSRTQVTVKVPPAPHKLWFSVKAQNVFGYWSNVVSVAFNEGAGINEVLSKADGTFVTARGLVTALFAGGLYIQQRDRLRGIRVVGSLPVAEGDELTISGTMTTINGERAIIY